MSSPVVVLVVGAYTAEMDGRPTGTSSMTTGDARACTAADWSQVASCPCSRPAYGFDSPSPACLVLLEQPEPAIA